MDTINDNYASVSLLWGRAGKECAIKEWVSDYYLLDRKIDLN